MRWHWNQLDMWYWVWKRPMLFGDADIGHVQSLRSRKMLAPHLMTGNSTFRILFALRYLILKTMWTNWEAVRKRSAVIKRLTNRDPEIVKKLNLHVKIWQSTTAQYECPHCSKSWRTIVMEEVMGPRVEAILESQFIFLLVMTMLWH